MKKIFILITLFNATFSNAQNVGIGVPNPQNKLHVGGGFRLDTLTGVNGAGLLWHNPNGVVYGLKFSGNTNDVFRGDGTFGSVSPGGAGSTGWLLTGNNGTNPAHNFLGTTDNQPLVFKVDNIMHGYLSNSSIFFGNNAGLANTGQRNIGIGIDALKNNQGVDNSVMGYRALSGNTNSFYNCALGSHALENTTSGSFNNAIGGNALNRNTSGYNNSALGYESLFYNTTGEKNTALGGYTLHQNVNGKLNTAAGSHALYFNTASENSAFGVNSLMNNKTGTNNNALGTYALEKNTTGNQNTAVGGSAIRNNSEGSLNTAVGYQALSNLTSGTSNTAAGMNSMLSLTSGHWNSALGTLAGPSVSNLLNTSCIGFNSQINISNAMSFGNTNVNRWVFGRLNITAGVFQVGSNLTNGNGAYLTAGGIWTSTSDENVKENFTELNSKEVLEKISALHITQWNFKSTPVKETHIGPMAQQFKQLFNLGVDGEDKSISTIDPAGIALVGIQQLHKEIKEQQVIIEKQQKLINDLSKRVEALEKK